MEQHEVPMINVSVILACRRHLRWTQNGLATLTATALMHGTKSMTKSKLEEELDYIGATLYTRMRRKNRPGLSAKFAAKGQG